MSISMAVFRQEESVVINDTLIAKKDLIYLDSFEFGLDTWMVEQMPGGTVEQKQWKIGN